MTDPTPAGPAPEPSAAQSSSPLPTSAPPAASSRPASLAAPSSPMPATHAIFPPDDAEPGQLPRPFDPPLTLITNTATGTTHHPRVYYIFSDEEPSVIQQALSVVSAHDHGFYDRAVIIDLEPSDTPSGWAVASASSMTTDWAVTRASFTPLGGSSGHAASANPSSARASSAPGSSGSDTEGDLILQIDGTDALPPARTVDIPITQPEDAQASNMLLEPGAKGYEALMNEFAERMVALERVVEMGMANLQRNAYMHMPLLLDAHESAEHDVDIDEGKTVQHEPQVKYCLADDSGASGNKTLRQDSI